MAYAAGVDVGSTQTKAVIIDEDGAIVGRSLIDTGANVVVAAEDAFAGALKDGRRPGREVELRRRHRLRPVPGDLRQHAGDRDQLPRPRRGAHVPRHPHRGRHGRTGHQGDPRQPDRRDPRLLHERQVRRRHRPLPRRRRGGARDPARRARRRSRCASTSRSRSAPPAPCSPSPRCCRGSGAGKKIEDILARRAPLDRRRARSACCGASASSRR